MININIERSFPGNLILRLRKLKGYGMCILVGILGILINVLGIYLVSGWTTLYLISGPLIIDGPIDNIIDGPITWQITWPRPLINLR